MIKSYSELIRLKTFEERFEYLKLSGRVSESTFSGHRMLNQILYNSDEWKEIRRKVILRDEGCDLALSGFEIFGKVMIHHINPITIDDIKFKRPCVYELENLVCCSFSTHQLIHYGAQPPQTAFAERKPYDTCPWRIKQ